MANLANREKKLKEHETKKRSTFTTHGFFGIIRKLHYKISYSESASVFSGYQSVKMLEDSQREFELQKSKAIVHISRLQTHFI